MLQNYVFYNKENTPIGLLEFSQKLIISYKKPISLFDYFNKNQSHTTDLRIIKREKLLQKFYNDFCVNAQQLYFKFYKSYLHFHLKPDYWKIRNIFLDDEKTKLSMQKNDAAKRIIRNLYYKELLEFTQISTSLPNKKTLLQAWNQLFNEFIMDDRYFSPSVLDQYLGGEPIHYFFQQYQPKASILNPYCIYFLFDSYFPDLLEKTNVIYTPVLSWSVYALAFCFSQKWNHYIGTDVMPTVCQKTNFLMQHFNTNPQKTFEIFNQPSEHLIIEIYLGKVDLVIFCPPYYKMEIYHENVSCQSTCNYPEYKTWLVEYWNKTVANCYLMLRQNGIFSFIIGNYTDYKTKIHYNLLFDCTQYMTNDQWKKISIIELVNRASPLRNNSKIRSEFLCVYQKI